MQTRTSLGTAVAEMYHRVFRPPFEVPLALIGNALLMAAAWFLLPPRAHDWLFSLSGPLAFPVIMASWMLGDTPSTNVVGHDTTKAISVLDDATAFRTWLGARSIVLASLVGVPCAIVAVIMGFEGQSAVKVVAACLVIAILPFGILPIAAWLGMLLPYNIRPLRWRWQHRRNWLVILRWAVLLLAPFVVVPAVGSAILSPGLALAHWGFGAPGHHLTNLEFVLVAGVICGTAVLAGWLGLVVAGRLRLWRHDPLVRYLLNPAAG